VLAAVATVVISKCKLTDGEPVVFGRCPICLQVFRFVTMEAGDGLLVICSFVRFAARTDL
jgi:hypothetical protein